MKKAYSVVLMAISIMVLSWFLPWLYSLVFPVSVTDPFVAYSPVSDSFIISESGDGKGPVIYELEADGSKGGFLTKEDRDSLLPHIYFTQLVGREKLPDSINGVKIGIPEFKHSQWVFNSIPRDINKRMADVYLIMESMPERFELEDAKEVFRLKGNGEVEFIDMQGNSVIEGRSRRFSDVFKDRGFKMPLKSFSANVTTRKPYDEGYLMVDDAGDIYHMKMQAGRPYMTKIRKPDSIVASHVFIMENVDPAHLGFMTDSGNNLYVIEKEGYRLVRLPLDNFDPTRSKLTVVKNLFNWVIKSSDNDGSRWVAISSDDYSTLGTYAVTYEEQTPVKIASYIFPFELSFTDVTDCYARPRVEYLSWSAIYLNIVLALIALLVFRRRHRSWPQAGVNGVVVLVFGIFAFIPFMIIRY